MGVIAVTHPPTLSINLPFISQFEVPNMYKSHEFTGEMLQNKMLGIFEFEFIYIV